MPALLLLQSASPAGSPSLLAQLFPFILLLGISWLLLFRPMMKEKREKQAMRDSLKSGDRVMSIGGIHGTVTKLGERTVHVQVAPGVQIEFARTAIASILPSESKE